MENSIEKLRKIIEKSTNIVFFGGAGVSTESGIPDFRGKDGLYHLKYKYPPEEILGIDFFLNNTEEFYQFYKDKMNSLEYQPSITHYKLTKLEQSGKLKAIITQNIDGLHQKAGSKNVYELHGSIMRNYCMECNHFYDAKHVFESRGVPKCKCGGIIKPDVVLYGENLDDHILLNSIKKIINADTLIVGGTSLTVSPANTLIQYFRGDNLVLINQDETPFDHIANIVIHEKIGSVFDNL
ncbi:MAG: NAD-dependent protein deacylase [Clostridia bacterium]|nr:NAD-dependent protein deacylase [Clostridia bacterium]